jgi:hypothetical protein
MGNPMLPQISAMRWSQRARILVIGVPLALFGQQAQAAVTISSSATSNMTCSGGVCAPTATNAVLNVNDLENLLASGNVEVTTTGSGVKAKDIVAKAALSWSNSSTLGLDAYRSITVNQPVSITGLAGLALDTNDGAKHGTLSFGKKGNVTFASLSSSLTINGASYTLVNSIKTLASAIAGNPSGDYALATGYNASQDGTYTSSPIPTTFTGNLEGLGNAIQNLTINDPTESTTVGFFTTIGAGGLVANLGLGNLSLTANQGTGHHSATLGGFAAYNYGTLFGGFESGVIKTGKYTYSGGIAAYNLGTVESMRSASNLSGKIAEVSGGLVGLNLGIISLSYATGTLRMSGGSAGGLAGENGGSIADSHATGNVDGTGFIGGLVGENDGPVTNCFASGAISGGGAVGGLVGDNFVDSGPISNSYATGSVTGGDSSHIGGFVGYNDTNGPILNSYSTGAAVAGSNSYVGGFAGYNDGTIQYAYSTGAPSGGTGAYVGGFVGYDAAAAGGLTDAYWDTDTSGIANLSQGAGNTANDPGITGLTTAQLQSGLPQGFDRAIWGENPNINDGLPYLLANPPPK